MSISCPVVGSVISSCQRASLRNARARAWSASTGPNPVMLAPVLRSRARVSAGMTTSTCTSMRVLFARIWARASTRFWSRVRSSS